MTGLMQPLMMATMITMTVWGDRALPLEDDADDDGDDDEDDEDDDDDDGGDDGDDGDGDDGDDDEQDNDDDDNDNDDNDDDDKPRRQRLYDSPTGGTLQRLRVGVLSDTCVHACVCSYVCAS